ncbi:MAG: FAD-dependent oxidoreductase [Candidatus Latescibacteria bacterium]|nr:FAD-dependent oxidoreductase [Candidatus Latescibacterota bacterium]
MSEAKQTEVKKIVIIGGVAGGASAAARARRLSETAEIILFERGEYISFANCGLPYHIGGTIKDRNKLLVQTPQSLYERFRIDVRTQTEVTSINRENKEVTVYDRTSGKESVESYDELVLSPGAEPFKPPIPGIDSKGVFTLRNMRDMDIINEYIENERPISAIVLGAGYIGLEMAEALRLRKLNVSIVELAPQVMVTADPEMAAPIKQQFELHGVDLRLNTSITGIIEDGDNLSVHLNTGEMVQCGMIILSVGVRPEVKLAREAGLEIGERGGIVVDEHMKTSDPHIYAVGDAIEVTDFVAGIQTLIPLAGPANRQGRIAADNIFGRESVYKKTQGTAICKVFDLAIAMTGMSEKNLVRTGRKYEKVYVHPATHATYYPGAVPLSLKLMFDPENGVILGAQAVGLQGVDKRIDVLSVAIRCGMTVYDLQHLELTYAPPFGSAKDPVNYAGFVATNVMRGDSHICHFEDVTHVKENQFLIDVRTPKEYNAGTIPGATNIPVDELRERISELPRNKQILAFCQVGLRAYIACRILTQHGLTCSNLTGGYKTYSAFMEALPEPGKEIVCNDAGQTDTSCGAPE